MLRNLQVAALLELGPAMGQAPESTQQRVAAGLLLASSATPTEPCKADACTGATSHTSMGVKEVATLEPRLSRGARLPLDCSLRPRPVGSVPSPRLPDVRYRYLVPGCQYALQLLLVPTGSA